MSQIKPIKNDEEKLLIKIDPKEIAVIDDDKLKIIGNSFAAKKKLIARNFGIEKVENNKYEVNVT